MKQQQRQKQRSPILYVKLNIRQNPFSSSISKNRVRLFSRLSSPQLPKTRSKPPFSGYFARKVMGDHMVLCVDQLITPESLQAAKASVSAGKISCSDIAGPSTLTIDSEEVGEKGAAGEEEPLIQTVECRICQEEDNIKNLEVPCACSGSLKFAHRNCVQRWCNEKGDITCEICHQVCHCFFLDENLSLCCIKPNACWKS
ncbi:unnamed protein product [Ilex paraguariensis]|uniref:RING-CH-type domain-containing protein n=1 Tax=Ilex paraguariensis TaxID=185542 RepID=A0ABC8QZB1_9AQUA